MVTRRRRGYCFHLNGALAVVLEFLGYDVTLHVGGVHGPEGPTSDDMTNHLVLLVHGLPGPGNPSGTWYVDAGLGDALHEPLPLIAGTCRRGFPSGVSDRDDSRRETGEERHFGTTASGSPNLGTGPRPGLSGGAGVASTNGKPGLGVERRGAVAKQVRARPGPERPAATKERQERELRGAATPGPIRAAPLLGHPLDDALHGHVRDAAHVGDFA